MTKIAYRINTTNPNIPNGFIVDHFDTDQDTVQGYTVVDVSVFQVLLQNNVQLLRQHELVKGVTPAAHDAPPLYQRPASDVQPIDSKIMEQRKQEMKQNTADMELFKEFLAWKRSQEQGS